MRWLISVALATLLHLLALMGLLPYLIPESEPPELSAALERETEVVLAREPAQPQSGRQIVSVNQPPTSDVPEDARFEDRYNRSVDEEMVARERSVSAEAVHLPQPVEEPQTTPQGTERRPDEARPRHRQQTPPEPVDDEAAMRLQPEEREDWPEDETSAEQPDLDTLSLAAFNPTMASASDLVALPGETSIDHLALPQGDRTQINSFENLYWSYWDRLKNQVRPHWHPAGIYRSRDPTGRVFGVEDRYTVVRVTLNGDGSVRHLSLERSSDLDFLDREALRAIQEAQPFANVPEGLKDERGLLSFRFGFYFEVSSSSFRIRREDW